MRFRSLITGALALALAGAGTIATSANAADPEPVDAEVGGGVAALQAKVEVGGDVVSTVLNDGNDYARYTLTYGRAVLGPNGGSREASALNKKIGPVTVRAAYNKISGNRRGTPFATAETNLLGVAINNIKFQALDVTCKWTYADGSSGSTTVIDVNGNATKPAPNTTREIPGLGTLVLNEQFVENSIYVSDPRLSPPYIYQDVLYVYGAHLHLFANAQAIYGVADVILGFTSCDPIKLPALSGLALGSNQT